MAAGTIAAVADRLFHDVMENLLDLELADRLQVGAAAARFGEDATRVVRQLADRLGAAGIDTDDVWTLGHRRMAARCDSLPDGIVGSRQTAGGFVPAGRCVETLVQLIRTTSTRHLRLPSVRRDVSTR